MMAMLACFLACFLLAMPACAESQRDIYLDAMDSISKGQTNEANDALARMIEQEPQHAGAWLDLAIIQCELGHAKEAERLFRIIESRFAPPPGIQEVIDSHRDRGCTRLPSSQWSILLGRGWDSNVNQGASSPFFSLGSGSSRIDLRLLPEFLPQHDQYTLLSTEYMRELGGSNRIGFVQLRARENDSLRRYNTASLRVGMEQPWKAGEWTVRGLGSLGILTLGNHVYQRQSQMQLRITPSSSQLSPMLPESFHFHIVTGLSRVQYATLANYDSTTTEAGGLLTYRNNRASMQAGAGYLTDHGGATRLGGDRNGWYANLQGQFRFSNQLSAEFGWTRQSWLDDTVYSPGLIPQIRRQHTHLLRAALIIPVKSQQTLNIEWRKVMNNENIPIFQYNSQLIQVTWQW